MLLRCVSFAAALSLAPLAVAAQDWAFDPSHTSVGFSVNHLGFSTVSGFFREFEGEIVFDPENIGATEVSFTLDAASIDTLWPARDEHLRSADFLDVASNPDITFVSTSVEPLTDTTAKITGDMTIKGVTLPVTFDATLNQIGENPFNPAQRMAGFTITGEIDRTAFGVDAYAPAVAAVLPVTINAELISGN